MARQVAQSDDKSTNCASAISYRGLALAQFVDLSSLSIVLRPLKWWSWLAGKGAFSLRRFGRFTFQNSMCFAVRSFTATRGYFRPVVENLLYGDLSCCSRITPLISLHRISGAL